MKMHAAPVFGVLAALALSVSMLSAEDKPNLGEKGVVWTDDYLGAMKQAETDNKDILMDFTGSDWCGWCIKLKKEVFDQDAFKTEGMKRFVFVEVDFPHSKKLLAKVTEQNQGLQKAFAIEGFPTIILADSKGRAYAKTGYQEGGPDAYLKHLDELQAKRKQRDEILAAADKAQGVERAKLLVKALAPLMDDGLLVGYEDLTAEIAKLDPKDETGFVGRANAGKQWKEIEAKLGQAQSAEEATKLVEEALKIEGLSGENKQKLYVVKFNIAKGTKDTEGMIAALKSAQAAAPDSELSKQIPAVLEQLQGTPKLKTLNGEGTNQ